VQLREEGGEKVLAKSAKGQKEEKSGRSEVRRKEEGAAGDAAGDKEPRETGKEKGRKEGGVEADSEGVLIGRLAAELVHKAASGTNAEAAGVGVAVGPALTVGADTQKEAVGTAGRKLCKDEERKQALRARQVQTQAGLEAHQAHQEAKALQAPGLPHLRLSRDRRLPHRERLGPQPPLIIFSTL